MLTLSGEADLTTVAELTEALTAQVAIGARHLTVDLSRWTRRSRYATE